jgi:ATP-independent RNA helicase DbpA
MHRPCTEILTKMNVTRHFGKIYIFDNLAYVAVQRAVTKQALRILSEGKIKGRVFRVRKLR